MTTPAQAHKFILFLLFSSFLVQLTLSPLPLIFILMAGQILSLLIPLLVYLALTGGGFMDRLYLKPFKARDVLRGICIVLLLQPFLMLLAALVEKVAGNPMEPLMASMATTPVWAAVIGLAVIPAIVEELVFRGYLLKSYRQLPLWVAALLSGVVFGMFHMNLYQFSYAMMLGFFFSVMTRRCGSVIPAMIMHFINNLISLLLIYQLDQIWYSGLEGILKLGTTPGPGLYAGVFAALLSLSSAWWLMAQKIEERLDETADQTGIVSGKFVWDWALGFFFLVFSGLTLVQPILNFIRHFRQL